MAASRKNMSCHAVLFGMASLGVLAAMGRHGVGMAALQRPEEVKIRKESELVRGTHPLDTEEGAT